MSFDTEELLFHMMDKALAIDVFDVLFFPLVQIQRLFRRL